MAKMKARVLLFDIEVSREHVEGYRNGWDFKVVKTTKHQEMMCFAYKWLGESKIHYVSRNEVTYDEMLGILHDILSEADVVIAHNGNKFDNKMANRFFIHNHMLPVRPYKSVDTLQVARSMFKFPGNSLNALCEYLGIGKKEKITYADIEDEFLNGDKKAERLMRKYNIQDVKLLEELYFRLRPWIKNHPNIGDIEQLDGVCPKCGSPNLNKEGTHARRGGRVQSYSCSDCGGWCNEASLNKKGRVVNA